MSSLVLIAAISCTSAQFHDTFALPDSSFPSAWTWTGDPRGEGVFEVRDETFVHVSGGHVHFFRGGDVCGAGVYEFDARDTDWGFAWRIRPSDPDEGPCYCFYHNDYWGNAYNFVEFDWWTLPEYAEGQYMWHNGWHTRIEHYYADPPTDWVHVTIEDAGDHVRVWVDWELIFDIDVEPIPGGYVGLGSSWAGPMYPAFDNVSYRTGYVEVSPMSWGELKALYR